MALNMKEFKKTSKEFSNTYLKGSNSGQKCEPTGVASNVVSSTTQNVMYEEKKGFWTRVPNNHVVIYDSFFFNNKKVLDAGFHLSSPFTAKTVVAMHDISIDYASESFKCADQNQIFIDVYLTYRVRKPLKLYDQSDAINKLHDTVRAWIADTISNYTLEEISKPGFKFDIKGSAAADIKKFQTNSGIEIREIGLQNLKYSEKLTQAMEAKAAAKAREEENASFNRMFDNTLQTVKNGVSGVSDAQALNVAQNLTAFRTNPELAATYNQSLMAQQAAYSASLANSNAYQNEQEKTNGRKK